MLSIGIKILYLTFPMVIGKANTDQSIYDQYIKITKKNDAYWYQKIATNGYPEITDERELGYAEGANIKQSEWAFFPFYPIVNKIIIDATGTNYNNSALIMSLLFSTLSLIGFFWFVLIFFKSESLAFFSTLVWCCFPFTYYYSMFYTEALFFTFMIFSFITIYYNKYFLFSILLIPLVLLRPNGIIILLPLYLFFLEQKGILIGYKVKWNELFEFKSLLHILPYLIGPIALMLYCYYQYKMTGHFFAFSMAQSGWNRELTFPLLAFFRQGDLSTQFNSIFTIILMIYAIIIWKKLPLSMNILIWISILLPLCSGSVTSMTRFTSVIFPLFLVLGNVIYKVKYKYTILFFILALHFLSYYVWVLGMPISY